MNTFDEKTHTYYIDGKRATGITSIIGVIAKPQLIGWAANCAVDYVKAQGLAETFLITDHVPPEFAGQQFRMVSDRTLEEARTAHAKKKEKAGEHGTDTHKAVEVYITKSIETNSGKPITLTVESIEPFCKWAVENVDHFLFSERKMFDPENFIAGTADFAYVGKDGKRYMGDFKTSSGVYGIDYWLQVAGYRYLAEKEGDKPYDGSTVVRLGKDGSFEALNRYDYETDKNAFLACLTLYRAQQTYK